MYDFASGINTKYNLGLEPTTISLVANEFASNPRRIIQMFNNLLVELDSLPEEISKNHQALVCKMLIIREEYPVFYQQNEVVHDRLKPHQAYPSTLYLLVY